MTLEPCLVIGRICVWSLELNSFYLLSGLYFILLIWDGFEHLSFLFDNDMSAHGAAHSNIFLDVQITVVSTRCLVCCEARAFTL